MLGHKKINEKESYFEGDDEFDIDGRVPVVDTSFDSWYNSNKVKLRILYRNYRTSTDAPVPMKQWAYSRWVDDANEAIKSFKQFINEDKVSINLGKWLMRERF